MKQKSRQNADHEDIEPIVWTCSIFVASFGLFWIGNTWTALAFCLIGVLYMASGWLFKEMPLEDKLRIEYNIYSAEDGLKDLVRRQDVAKAEKDPEGVSIFRTSTLALLPALAKKYSKLHAKLTQQEMENNEVIKHHALVSQKAAYIGLNGFEDDDEVVMAAFALLALVSKEPSVKIRHYEQADQFGLDVLVEAMKRAQKRAKGYNTESKEQLAAEVQRKGCLLLGALADKDSTLADQICQEGGVDAIAGALSWFRCHSDMVNWALWALFTICYEHEENKFSLDDHAPVILESMRNSPESLEVARHGTALLFDLLRETRMQAAADRLVSAGLEKTMMTITELHSDASDIQMMGQEILARARNKPRYRSEYA